MSNTFSGSYPIERRAGEIERLHVQSRAMAPGLALLFLILAAFAASLYAFGEPHALFVVFAAAIAAYLATVPPVSNPRAPATQPEF